MLVRPSKNTDKKEKEKKKKKGNCKVFYVKGKCNNQYETIILPPMVIVKNLAKAPKGTFLNGMLIRGTKERTMKKGIMKSRYGIEL